MNTEEHDDWARCVASLEAVSRTFSRPIELLEAPLREAVTVGYLLCRVADSIEDCPGLAPAMRAELLGELIAVLDGGATGGLRAGFPACADTDAEAALVQDIDTVLRVMGRLEGRARGHLVRHVQEMCRGMALYAHRPPGEDGLVRLRTGGDFERYCYFVAGTVGHLLTDLFLDAHPELPDERRRLLRVQAESFGSGLQHVNILKDVTDDLERGWCFLPDTLLCGRRPELPPDGDFDPAVARELHGAIAPLFDQARAHLDGGLAYTLALPEGARGIRLFCLLPLWMAVRTLAVTQGNNDAFVPGRRVRIERPEAEAIIGLALANVDASADALARIYRALHDRDARELVG